LAAADRAYVARLVAAQTGLNQADAERRVNDAIVEAKAAADATRRGAAKLAFWMTAALFFGAFARASQQSKEDSFAMERGTSVISFRVLGE